MTRLEHLKKLPLQKRLQAMEEIRKAYPSFSLSRKMTEEVVERFTLLFIFDFTRKGHDYWWGIYEKYFM